MGIQDQTSRGEPSAGARGNSGSVISPGRIVSFFVWTMLVNGVVWALRKGLSAPMEGQRGKPSASGSVSAIQLHRDPICGTHVSPEISFTLDWPDGKKHFCSAECRDRFQRSHRSAASA